MKKGLTLIELLVSLTILSLFVSSFFCILSTMVRSSKDLVKATIYAQVTNNLFKVISNDLFSANKILATSTPSQLGLQIGNDIVEYYCSGDEVKRRKNGSPAPLSNPGEIKNLSFSISERMIEIKIDHQSLAVSLRN